MAQILTQNSIESLITLDAGDTVECYSVSRLAKIESFGEVDYSESQPTGPDDRGRTVEAQIEKKVTVRKAAIAFRFKSRIQSSSSRYSTLKPPFELTLEYGPERTGDEMDSESIPTVLMKATSQGDNDIDKKVLRWGNEGKIYFEKSISPSRWDTADYIVSINGAVLSNILSYALDYPLHKKRYQPFEVYDVTRESVVIPSSSSEDFVWEMYERMAQMYVDIRPILTPTRSKLRLYVDGLHSIKKLMIGHASDEMSYYEVQEREDVGREVVEFYENIYSCTNDILNGNYQIFLTEDEIKEIKEDVKQSNEESHLSNVTVGMDDSGKSNNSSLNEETNYIDGEGGDDVQPDDYNLPEEKNQDFQHESLQNNTYYDDDDFRIFNYSDSLDDANGTNEEDFNYRGRQLGILHPDSDPKDIYIKSVSPTSFSNLNATLETTPSPTPQSTKYPESSTAAQATAIAISQTAKSNLLSGVGPSMTSALLPCITSSSNDNENTFGYLYVDSSTYYRLNLTHPFMNVAVSHPDMPTPASFSVGTGDFFDWMFVMLIISGLFYGVFRILKRSGLLNDRYDLNICLKRLLNFEESSYTDEGFGFERTKKNDKSMVVGGGMPHKFGLDVIPPSMGGELPTRMNEMSSSAKMRVENGVTIICPTNSHDNTDDHEYSSDIDAHAASENDIALTFSSSQRSVNRRSSNSLQRWADDR